MWLFQNFWWPFLKSSTLNYFQHLHQILKFYISPSSSLNIYISPKTSETLPNLSCTKISFPINSQNNFFPPTTAINLFPPKWLWWRFLLHSPHRTDAYCITHIAFPTYFRPGWGLRIAIPQIFGVGVVGSVSMKYYHNAIVIMCRKMRWEQPRSGNFS